jgi:hypothetical protein
MRMREYHRAIHKAIRGILKTAWANYNKRIHRLGGRDDRESRRVFEECHLEWADQLCDLSDLLNSAVPAAIDAGFGGEVVLAWNQELLHSAHEAARWYASFDGDLDDDRAAWCHLKDLEDRVWADLIPLGRIADVAYAREGADSPEEYDDWLPASEAVEQAAASGHPITMSTLSKLARKGQVRARPWTRPGPHQLEVEWNTLAGYLLRRAADKKTAGEEDGEPPEGQFAGEIAIASKEKKRARPLN